MLFSQGVEADVIGDDIGEGEVRGEGDDPGQGLVLLVEGLQGDVGYRGDADLGCGKEDRAFYERLHQRIPFLESGVFEACAGGEIVGGVEGDHGREVDVEEGITRRGGPGIADEVSLAVVQGSDLGVELEVDVVGIRRGWPRDEVQVGQG